ncbi:MAG: response regulator [Planctomycetota bacterium]
MDDCPDNIEGLVGLLGEDHEVCFALSGEEALDLIERLPRIDLILLDIGLPGLDGYEVLRRLRLLPQVREVPVMVITGRDEVESETRALELGAVDYITKPFQTEVARARIRTHLEQSRLRERILHSQKVESLGLLAGGIAHDFNNLLVGVIGFADLARRSLPQDAEEARSWIDGVLESGRTAAELCKQLVAYAGKGRFVVTPLDLNEQIAGLRDLLAVSTSQKADLVLELGPDLPPIEGDATQIRQVLLNLVLNASEALGPPGGAIRVRTRLEEGPDQSGPGSWTDGAPPPGPRVVLEVQDDGPGMAPEVRRKVFDPFFSTKRTGRGLGLAAVLGIVRGHGGAIGVESQPGQGTTFRVLFPTTDRGLPAADSPDPPGGWRGHGTALLVDDDETVRAVGRALLTEAGFEVLTAAHGLEALEQYRAHGARIRVVVLDLKMPVMDGETTLHELRALDPGVRIVLCSGYNEQLVINRFTRDGLAQFVTKPYDAQSLLRGVRRALER